MNKFSQGRNIALCSALLLFSSCTGLGIDRSASSTPMRNNLAAQVVIDISVAEARRIATAHEMTGRRALPPGIQRNLARGKPLPPGIARQVLPQGMLRELPVYPDHEWRVAGDDLVLIALGTQLVVELLLDVFQ